MITNTMSVVTRKSQHLHILVMNMRLILLPSDGARPADLRCFRCLYAELNRTVSGSSFSVINLLIHLCARGSLFAKI